MKVRNGIGRSCRRFLSAESVKPCVLAGIVFEDSPGLAADSDGDVIFHAICHAIGTLVCKPLLDLIADELCYKQGITDSQVYVEEALKYLNNQRIEHVAIHVEAREPHLIDKLDEMRKKIANVLLINLDQVGFSFISGEGLSDVSCGEGVEAICIITTMQD
jgi:2-C-methyl-D-erythritol 2,4-cyclodiphosphate synthase